MTTVLECMAVLSPVLLFLGAWTWLLEKIPDRWHRAFCLWIGGVWDEDDQEVEEIVQVPRRKSA